MDKKIIRARNLRVNQTPQELKLWNLLRARKFHNLKFRRQYHIGNYIVDFICREKKIIIEIDGGQHNFDENVLYDNNRTEFLHSKGYKVIRFWNNDIDNNLEGVYAEIEKFL